LHFRNEIRELASFVLAACWQERERSGGDDGIDLREVLEVAFYEEPSNIEAGIPESFPAAYGGDPLSCLLFKIDLLAILIEQTLPIVLDLFKI